MAKYMVKDIDMELHKDWSAGSILKKCNKATMQNFLLANGVANTEFEGLSNQQLSVAVVRVIKAYNEARMEMDTDSEADTVCTSVVEMTPEAHLDLTGCRAALSAMKARVIAELHKSGNIPVVGEAEHPAIGSDVHELLRALLLTEKTFEGQALEKSVYAKLQKYLVSTISKKLELHEEDDCLKVANMVQTVLDS